MGIGAKLPRINITVEGNEGDESTSGKFSILSIGFGIHQAWIYASMFGASQIFELEAFVDLPSHSYYSFMPATLVFLISIIVFSICLIFISFSDQKFLRLYVSKRFIVGAVILTSISTFTVFASATDSLLGWIALVFSGIATGVGSSVLLVSWGTAFSRHGAATIVINTAAAIVIAVAIYSAILHWLPSPLSGIATALLPLFELIFLWRLTPIPYLKRHEVPIFNELPIKRAPFISRFGLPVLIFGFALGALRAVSMQVILPSTDLTSQLIAWVAAGVAMILTLFMLFTIGNDRHWDHLFRSLVPFIVVAIIALPFLNGEDSFLVNLVLLAGFMSFEALMWIFFGELSQEFRISPIFVFGLGRGLLAFGSLIGSLLALYSPDFFFFEVFGRTGGAILLLLAMVVAYMLLPRQREIKAMVDQNSSMNDEVIASLNAQVKSLTEEYSPENAAKGGRFRTQCEMIADSCLLSRRETEVLFFLAKGHNAAFIQDKLCISRSTTKTHISHIYRKLDIHTQQELLSMVESKKDEVRVEQKSSSLRSSYNGFSSNAQPVDIDSKRATR